MRSGISFSFLKKVDLFDKALPQFNLKGKSSIGTVFGGVLSLAILYLTFLFGCTKLVHLIERRNPTVNTYTRADAYENEEKLSLNDFNFMMAFTVENYYTHETLNDPRYTKWHAYLSVGKDSVVEPREVPVYPCRDEDFARFYPIDVRSRDKLDWMKTDSKR